MLTFIFWYLIGIVVSIMIIKLIAVFEKETEKTDIEDKETHKFVLWMIFLSWVGVIILSVILLGMGIMHIFSTDSKFYRWLIGYKEKE